MTGKKSQFFKKRQPLKIKGHARIFILDAIYFNILSFIGVICTFHASYQDPAVSYIVNNKIRRFCFIILILGLEMKISYFF